MKKSYKRDILVLSLLFISLLVLLLFNKTSFLDDYFYNKLILLESNNLTNYFLFITKFANSITIVILSVISLIPLIFKYKKTLFLIGAIIISTILNQSLKHIIKRDRPIVINKIIENGYSFPSGHAMASVTFYGFIIYLIISSKMSPSKKWILSLLLLFLIINICLSRIYLGVHFTTDVLAGVMLSCILLVITIHFIEKINWHN
ncbi:MAG: phosphatase PAP2 family protein [Bacilli bacterium]|nr:phosphatase PAP2 family protein [Bacilli bacterium]